MQNYSESEESGVTKVVKDQAKKQGKKLAKKVAKKAAKAAVKAVAQAAMSAVSTFITFLASLGLPFILITLGILAFIFLVYVSVTLMFSSDSNVLDTGPEKELYEYIQTASDATVDSSKPEQIPYKVPPALIVAALQIYDSEKHIGVSDKKAVKIVADALKPVFHYTTRKGYVETKTKTCKKNKIGTEICTSKNEKTPFTLNSMDSVESWDRTVTFTNEETTTGWAKTSDQDGDTTTDTQSRASTYTNSEKTEMDYTYYNKVLSGSPFNYGTKDKKTVEALYQATGGQIQYTEWLNGDKLVVTGLVDLGMLGSDVDVTPGSNVPAQFMKYYLAGQKKYGVPWYFLAAIHRVETGFSTNVNVSSAGAIGPTQFMPCTWIGWNYGGCKYLATTAPGRKILATVSIINSHRGYGTDGDGDGKADPWNEADAIMSTARYLAANHFSTNQNDALWAYNKSITYRNDVVSYANQFKNAAKYNASAGSGAIPPSNGKGAMKPMVGGITSGYGWRNLGYGPEFHYGVDIGGSIGTKVAAISPGVVTRKSGGCPTVGNIHSNCGQGWGNYLWVKHNVNGQIYEAVYAHLSAHMVQVGDKVEKGQIIALSGCSGRITGPHLHFEIHKNYRNGYANVVPPGTVIPLSD
ncbi:peptidoglycan DD-metalloendopeptidase family protein [Rummeliibacillus stabekisii]|uniref:peptidoglycan DD-metalloendopeptidase family protein n=1 Tax=Rummeliibacillus stabekisii TaxID=241244 RepID=UPI00116E6708|nr:peptidoglycan DD-metalloendopeptidase family protein [Rummeliibacillus stabekisii]MBB5171556.1 murein DD-endopeptidase MepM/ murein hydrolase activator NlpD [Rummeliibacillus stabekisii]GEL05524.1 hypothetical protein RST01_21510 [Rummeliibacillus stabekisii]